MISLDFKTAPEINKELADRMVRIRKRKKITQKELASKSGVSYASIRRFESTGEISLLSFTKIAMILKLQNELEDLFLNAKYESMEEIFNEQRRKA